MKKRLLSVFVFLAIFSFNCIGQQQIPIKNVPSPEIAGLGEYGKVPVSLYTGVPDISVPIYELKAGNYSLSLAASYHLASVKPNSQSILHVLFVECMMRNVNQMDMLRVIMHMLLN